MQTFVSNLAYELSVEETNEVHVVCFAGQISDKFAYLNDSNITFHFLGKKRGASLKFLIKLYKTINQIKPDIINSHSSRTLRYLLMLPINRRYKIVHTITNNPRIYNKKMFPLYLLRMHQKSWQITFVGISDIVSDTLSEVYHYDRRKIRTIYNGVRMIGVTNESPKIADFFICATLSEIKRHKLLLEALAVMKERPTLLIAGDGPLRSEIEARIKELMIDNEVTLLGNVENPTEYYQRTKFFILTSKSEGNPLCIIEAMSAGQPIIAPRVGGIPDLVEDGVNGFLFDVDETPGVVADLMNKCLQMEQGEYDRISQKNAEKAKQWSIDRIAQEYMNLFVEVRQ